MSTGRYWHPFADMQAVNEAGELIIDRADGYYIWDDQGRRYLDATASLWYCNVGHGRQEIIDAVATQMARLEAYSTFGDLTNRPVIDLVERVTSLAPVEDSVLFLTSGGSDSIDTAVKLARRYFQVTGQPSRRYVIGRKRGYHGMHTAGTSIGGIEPNVDGYGELLRDVGVVEWDSHEHLAATIDELGAENVAAFVCEPVIGAGGVMAPPPGYLEKARVTCRDAGVLFVADEVVTGFGRTGYWFASERFDLDPDMITCAKGITSGYLPMGAVVVAPEVAEPWYHGGAGMWRHGYTYSGHATVAAAALANLKIVEDDGLLANARHLERALEQRLGPLARHDLVSEVRAGVGALAAVQLDPAVVADDSGLPARVLAACRRSGIMTRMLVGNAVHVSPPLTLDDAGVEELAGGLRAALDAVAGS
jgi:adenosylmethionine-8-amino-7-oxononanoate aminotransferase